MTLNRFFALHFFANDLNLRHEVMLITINTICSDRKQALFRKSAISELQLRESTENEPKLSFLFLNEYRSYDLCIIKTF